MQSYLTEKRVAVTPPLFKILKDSELSFDQQEKCIKHGKNNESLFLVHLLMTSQ